jgi:hypothetical protein
MSRLLTVAATALTALALSSSFATAGGFYPPFVAHYDPPPSGGSSGGNGNSNSGVSAAPRVIKLACIVGGTPSEFPNDIWMTNTTSATMLKGTVLSFTIPSVGVKGSFLLPSNVPAGQQVRIADIFGGAEAGSPCSIKLV